MTTCKVDIRRVNDSFPSLCLLLLLEYIFILEENLEKLRIFLLLDKSEKRQIF